MVLAVALAKALERARVLPEVRLVKEVVIAHVLALQEPALDLVQRGGRDAADPFQVPTEVVS